VHINKIVSIFKKWWLAGVLVICLLSAFLIPSLSLIINSLAVLVIIIKILNSLIKNKKGFKND
jgi:hypothetical protein